MCEKEGWKCPAGSPQFLIQIIFTILEKKKLLNLPLILLFHHFLCRTCNQCRDPFIHCQQSHHIKKKILKNVVLINHMKQGLQDFRYLYATQQQNTSSHSLLIWKNKIKQRHNIILRDGRMTQEDLQSAQKDNTILLIPAISVIIIQQIYLV